MTTTAHFDEKYDLNISDPASLLGTGAFSKVYRCKSKQDGNTYAVKVINAVDIRPSDKIKIEREAQICALVHHDNIVKFYDFFREKENYFLVFELVTGGELFDEIVLRQCYSERDASHCVAQILSSLKECHGHNVIHRDIKPENLILASHAKDAAVKLTDFGLAIMAEPVPRFYGFAGTPGYLAPEVCFRGPYGKAVDVWSTGVVLYILLCGYPPFWHEDTQQMYEQIKACQYDFASAEWDDVTPEAKDLVSRMLEGNPDRRITVDEALNHKWVRDGATVASPMHRRSTVEWLKKFNARRKLRGGVQAIISARRLLDAAKKHSEDEPDQVLEHPPIEEESGIQIVLEANETLLRAIASADWELYSSLTDASLTAIEPEAPGMLIEGKEFHKFFFDHAVPSKDPVRMINPKCRILGNVAIVTYCRIVENTVSGKVQRRRFEETRIWQQFSEGVWRNVHFHRSESAL